MNISVPKDKILIQFDGMCILCSRMVRFILKTDRKRKFLFQALQNSYDNKSSETIIVKDQDSSYKYFDAVLKIGKELGGIYNAVYVFRIIPQSWRRFLYLWIAANRYRWFGTRQSCYLPSGEEAERFI